MSIEAMNQALERVDRAIEEPNITMSDGKALKEILRQLHLIKDTLRAAIAEASKQDVQQEIEAPRVIKRYGHGVDEILLVEDTPPRREWVGLTDGDIAQACGFGEYTTSSTQQTLIAIARAIEAKLKEKNT
jgi:hypothetical protein